MTNTKQKLIKWFHLFTFCYYAFALYYDYNYVNIPGVGLGNGLRGRTRFLTYWCLIWQAVYFTLCVLNDFIGTNEVHPKRPSKIRQIKDFVFATFSFPLAMNVAISFWAIYAVDRELIFPKSIETFFPSWLNHVMHTNIVFFIMLDLVISFRQYPVRKTGVTCLLVFLLGYTVWIHIIKYMSGKWVYPILEVLNLPMRILFMAFTGAFGISFYYVGEYLNNMVWANELKSTKSSGKKHK